MTHVPIAQAKDRLSEYVAQAMAGVEVVLTKHGKETVRLVPVEKDRQTRWKKAVEGWAALGREIEEKYGSTEPGAVERWLKEDRRYD
jgi:prevent-host-death family protein